MDRRTRRRHRQIRLARKVADYLNRPKLGRWGRSVKLLSTERPGRASTPNIPQGGFTRRVITMRRPVGRVSIYWHTKSRTFRAKIDRQQRALLGGPRRRLVDAMASVSGLVCRCRECGMFFAKVDARQIYCGPQCAARRRQRRHRARQDPAAREAYVRTEELKRAHRDRREASLYNAEQYERALDQAARAIQRVDRRGNA